MPKKKKNFYSRERLDLTADQRTALEAKKQKHKLKRKQRKNEKKGLGSCASESHTATTSPAAEILAPDASVLVQDTKRLSVLFWNVSRIYHYFHEFCCRLISCRVTTCFNHLPLLLATAQMLAQINIFDRDGRSKYGHCATQHLMWNWRKHLIYKLLVDSGADVLCLQEVDQRLFVEDILPYLQSMVWLFYDMLSTF